MPKLPQKVNEQSPKAKPRPEPVREVPKGNLGDNPEKADRPGREGE